MLTLKKHPQVLAAVLLLATTLSFLAHARPYKGAEIYAYSGNTYGKYVMRMKVAKGSGILSTFFLYKAGSQEPGAFWEEIDVEIFGQNNATQWESNIIYGSPKKETYLRHTSAQSLADSYNTYTVEWTPSYVAWFVNGQQIRRINGGAAVTSLTSAQTMRFNLWSAFAESWVGPFDPAILPVHQFINWVEYHRYVPATGGFALDWRDDFNSLDSGRWGRAAWTFDDNRVDFVPENVVVKDGVLVLALTREGATGFNGTVPADGGGVVSSSSSSSSVRSSSSSLTAVSSSSSVRSSSSSVRSSVSSTSGCRVWVAGVQYYRGNVVSYNGSYYIAEHDNPGYIPTVSTYFWDPVAASACNGSVSSSSQSSAVARSSSSSTASFTRLIQAEAYSIMAGVQTETTTDTDGGRNVGWIDADDWMAYDNITIPATGTYKIELRLASINGSLLSLDLNAGRIQLGEVRVPATGGWQTWSTVSHIAQLQAGTFSLGVYAQQGGWNINWIKITRM